MEDKKKRVEYTTIGGQAVIEGVMMRAPEHMALAVRKPDGSISLEIKDVQLISKKYKPLGWPIIRGVVSFVNSLSNGVTMITRSAELSGLDDLDEDDKESRTYSFLDKISGGNAEKLMLGIATALGLIFAVGLFFVLPSLLASLMKPLNLHYLLMNLCEGAIRILIFGVYLLLVSRMKDIYRVYQYHGAEHKTIHCYETYGEATLAKAREMSCLHPRCGTSFLLIVMVTSILVFSFVGRVDNAVSRVLVRLALLPVVAGVSYEFLKLLALRENGFTRALRAPGLLLQRLTTKEPDDSMIEVAIAAFYGAKDGKEMDNAGVAAGEAEE